MRVREFGSLIERISDDGAQTTHRAQKRRDPAQWRGHAPRALVKQLEIGPGSTSAARERGRRAYSEKAARAVHLNRASAKTRPR